MGICLGFQLLFSQSEEFGAHSGLNLIKGNVVRFPETGRSGQKIKVPKICWSEINKPVRARTDIWDNTPLKDSKDGELMYFVHSYFVIPDDDKIILSISEYEGLEYCSSIKRDNIFGCQFHPEKSAGEGLKIYSEWAKQI